ncbi:MAG: hypothetical protein JXK07_03940 [Spirochaetes bacterium]|nr:hypothetical protein [Spirochaetota bacterium]MBN2770346.1 hypothetical protein [Spirochaetota bacterium]
MGFKIKDTILKAIGYIFAIPGLLVFFIGIAMYLVSKDSTEVEAGAGLTIFSMAFVLPGIFFLYRGYKATKEEEMVESLAMIIHATRRISIDNIAEKMGVSVPTARRFMLIALKQKLINGFFDRTTGEFFTEEGKTDTSPFKFCPHCGSPFNRMFLHGETIKCPSCGSVFSGNSQ